MTAEGWTTVTDGAAASQQDPEVKIVFEEHGDSFSGEFLGYRNLTDRESGQRYKQARFRAEDDGAICFTRANHSMQEGLDRVPIGTMTKVTYVDDLDTGQASPMRCYTVQTRGSAATPSIDAGGRPVRRAASSAKPAGKPVKDNPQA